MKEFFDGCEIVVAVSVDGALLCLAFDPMPRDIREYRRWAHLRARARRYSERIARALGCEFVAVGRNHHGMRPVYRRGAE